MTTQYNVKDHGSDDEDQCESPEEHFDDDDDDDDDYGEEFDYDNLDLGNDESEQPTENMHPLLVQDIERIKHKYGEKAIGYRKFEDIGDIDIELHVPGNHFDYDVAQAWKIKRDEDIIVRLHMDLKTYLDAKKEPKIEVFQPSQKKFSTGIQIKNIIELFLVKVWPTFSNAPVVPAAGNDTRTVSKQARKNPEPQAAASMSQDAKRIPSRDSGFCGHGL